MKYANQIIIANQIVRWTSSNNIPPADCLQQMVNDEQITKEQMTASLERKNIEDAEAIAQYIASRKNRGYSDEEMFEMRAAFGEGEEVMDIFTGETIRL